MTVFTAAQNTYTWLRRRGKPQTWSLVRVRTRVSAGAGAATAAADLVFADLGADPL